MKTMLTRRDLLQRTAALAAAGLPPGIAAGADDPGSIERIEHLGVVVSECGIPGETRHDDVVPAHPNGIQVSRDRWLLIFATRGFRGVDDDRALVFQLRAGAPDGRLVREGVLVRTRDDWDPFGDSKRGYVKQHGHPVLFGVPRGARIGGRPAPSANVFVLKWRQVARVIDHDRNLLVRGPENDVVKNRSQTVGWLQFRLNDREDNVEVIQPEASMRQKGFETGPAFCSAPGVAWINQTYTQAVPFNAEATEWADANYFDNGRAAALKYTFNAKLGRYEWTATGPFLFDEHQPVTEPSLAPWKGGWVAAGRMERRGILWARTDDPFSSPGKAVWVTEPPSPAPRTAYTCPDGVLRLLTNDPERSPHKQQRDPLYLFDVDPEQGFRASNPRVIFDTVAAGLPIRGAASPMIDMAKLLPATGRVQYLLHRVMVQSYNSPYLGSDGKVNEKIPVINAAEKACLGIYLARITYRSVKPGPWEL